jgi:AcrR family transcriptional regulator
MFSSWTIVLIMPASTNARARVRAELTREIKEAARAELALAGAGALSLRAVARRMDMVPSALYRYFDGRDALLTALIIEAYQAVGDAAEAADRDAGPAPGRRWMAMGRAVRAWAWDYPSQWALIYGSPVPGYQAPADTLEAGTRILRLLTRVLVDTHRIDRPTPLPIAPAIDPELHRWLSMAQDVAFGPMRDEVVALGVVAYTYLLGAVSVELFGQFGPDATPAVAMFDAGLRTTGLLLALPGIAGA